MDDPAAGRPASANALDRPRSSHATYTNASFASCAILVLPRTKSSHFVDTGIERIESVRHTDPFQSAFRREASGKLDVGRAGYRDTQRAIALPRMVVQQIPVTPALRQVVVDDVEAVDRLGREQPGPGPEHDHDLLTLVAAFPENRGQKLGGALQLWYPSVLLGKQESIETGDRADRAHNVSISQVVVEPVVAPNFSVGSACSGRDRERGVSFFRPPLTDRRSIGQKPRVVRKRWTRVRILPRNPPNP